MENQNRWSLPHQNDWSREFVELQFRCLLSLLSNREFYGKTTGIDELTVDGLPANSILFVISCEKSPVPAAVELILVLFVVRKGEFLHDFFGDESNVENRFPKRSPSIQVSSMCQEAEFVAAQHGTRTWNHCRLNGNVRQSPTVN